MTDPSDPSAAPSVSETAHAPSVSDGSASAPSVSEAPATPGVWKTTPVTDPATAAVDFSAPQTGVAHSQEYFSPAAVNGDAPEAMNRSLRNGLIGLGAVVVVAGLIGLLLFATRDRGGSPRNGGTPAASPNAPNPTIGGNPSGDPNSVAGIAPNVTQPTATTGRAGAATNSSTSTAAPTPTTAPPAPTVSAVDHNPDAIWESYAKGECATTTTSKIGVYVSDQAGVNSVIMDATVNGTTTSQSMSRVGTSDRFEAVLGPFASGSVPKSSDIGLNITAKDSGGRTSSTTSSVFLHSATEC